MVQQLVKRTQNSVSHNLQAGLEQLPLRQIAQEIAQRIEPLSVILHKYGVSLAQWHVIKSTNYFKSLVREALQEWNAGANAEQRVRAKAGKALEDSIVVLYEIAHDVTAASPARISAVERMAKLAGMDKVEAGVSAGKGPGGFAINIVINPNEGAGNAKTINVSATKMVGECSEEVSEEEDSDNDE